MTATAHHSLPREPAAAPAAERTELFPEKAQAHVRFSQLGKIYEGQQGPVAALQGIDLDIQRGEIFGIIGRSGAGKSSLIRTINRLEQPSSGRVLIDQVDIAAFNEDKLVELRRRIGMIFQHFNLMSAKTVWKNVELPLKVAGVPKEQRRRKVAELLELVGLQDKHNAYPAQLSGGQKQRVGIARAIAVQPKLLILDEPTNGLDPSGMRDMRALIRDLPERTGATVFMSSHLLSEVEQIATHVGVMRQGETVFDGAIGALAARTGQRLEIRCDKPDAAIALAGAHGFSVLSRDDVTGSIVLTGDGDPARFNAALVGAGIAVSALAPLRADLESLFLDLTSAPRKEAAA